jgi:hypothetical protein
LALVASSLAPAASIQTFTLCSAVITTGTSTGITLAPGPKTIQGTMTVSSGAGSATVAIEGSLDGTFYDSLGILTISDTVSDSVTLLAPSYQFYRCNVTAESGTGKSVTVKGASP